MTAMLPLGSALCRGAHTQLSREACYGPWGANTNAHPESYFLVMEPTHLIFSIRAGREWGQGSDPEAMLTHPPHCTLRIFNTGVLALNKKSQANISYLGR